MDMGLKYFMLILMLIHHAVTFTSTLSISRALINAILGRLYFYQNAPNLSLIFQNLRFLISAPQDRIFDLP